MSGSFAVDSNAFVAYRAGDLAVQRFMEGATLLTQDRHFQRIDGLSVQGW